MSGYSCFSPFVQVHVEATNHIHVEATNHISKALNCIELMGEILVEVPEFLKHSWLLYILMRRCNGFQGKKRDCQYTFLSDFFFSIWKAVQETERDRERDSHIFDPLAHSSNTSANPKPGVSSGPPAWEQGPKHLGYVCCFPKHVSMVLDHKWSSQDSNWCLYETTGSFTNYIMVLATPTRLLQALLWQAPQDCHQVILVSRCSCP